MEASQAWGTATYVYDSQNQLIRENNPAANKTMTWEYDAAGNILNRKEYAYTTGTLGTPTRTVNYGYGDADWGDLLTSYNGMTITYDEIGNPLTGRNGSMTWEHGRQLASMGEWQFTYDANGMRRTRTDTESGDIYRYFYTGGQLKSMRAETDEAYVDYTFYYDAGGNPLAASYFVDYWSAEEYTEYMGMFYYVTNAQGDVTALVSETGELLVTYDYDAWGKPVRTDYYEVYTDYGLAEASQFVSQNPFRYRGYVYDTETGLYYLQSRYYDPEVGRFINADAFAATGQGLVGNNMFAYCNNAPVVNEDSSGQRAVLATKDGLYAGRPVIVEKTDDHDMSNALLEDLASGIDDPSAFKNLRIDVSYIGRLEYDEQRQDRKKEFYMNLFMFILEPPFWIEKPLEVLGLAEEFGNLMRPYTLNDGWYETFSVSITWDEPDKSGNGEEMSNHVFRGKYVWYSSAQIPRWQLVGGSYNYGR